MKGLILGGMCYTEKQEVATRRKHRPGMSATLLGEPYQTYHDQPCTTVAVFSALAEQVALRLLRTTVKTTIANLGLPAG